MSDIPPNKQRCVAEWLPVYGATVSVGPRECLVVYPWLSVGSPCCFCVSRLHILTSEPFDDLSSPNLLRASHPNVVF